VFFHKPRSKVEVLNDLDEEIINFLRVAATPAGTESDSSMAACQSTPLRVASAATADVLTDLERAARFFYLQKNTWGGKRTTRTFISPSLNRQAIRLQRSLSAC